MKIIFIYDKVNVYQYEKKKSRIYDFYGHLEYMEIIYKFNIQMFFIKLMSFLCLPFFFAVTSFFALISLFLLGMLICCVYLCMFLLKLWIEIDSSFDIDLFYFYYWLALWIQQPALGPTYYQGWNST